MWRRSEHRGQALVEFALVIPLFLLVVCGLFDVGRVVFISNGLSDGARHGARHASVDPRAAGYCQSIDNEVRSAVLDQPLTLYTVEYQRVGPDGSPSGDPLMLCQNGVNGPDWGTLPSSAAPGDRVTVTLETDVDLILGFVIAAVGDSSFDLHANSTMQVTFAP